ncbi:hypothetical protein Ddye_017719 [Dipteronia dyeriana]|uniref:Endonuclease/exonuclease/phosphatase domain-containing protein n=1 Tax=Dipteronia dyeriana TaxID=168575 RepID=A0AAD9UA70_9ROSI|nr:hypothetical protein Ddye_017719 [Dipteronia dyeriana]
MITKRRVHNYKNRKCVRLGFDASESKNFYNQKGKEEGLVDKGKQTYVRNSKRRTSHAYYVNGKLQIGKSKAVRSNTKSWTSSSESSMEEGQLRNFGLEKDESSKLKSMGKRPKVAGPSSNSGQQRDRYHSSLEDGLIRKTNSKSSDPEFVPYRESSLDKTFLQKGPKQILRQRQDDRLTDTSWNLDVEMEKVIEVRVALGFDFNNKEEEIREVIARREKEDNDRLKTMTGKNVCGLGKGEKRRSVSGLVHRLKPEILLIQESKLRSFDNHVIRSLGGSWLSRGVGVDVEGASGGIIISWNEGSFKVESYISNKKCIILVGILLKVNKKIVICNVYAPSIESDRRDLWNFILFNMQSFKAPWCVGGYFNTVLEPSERVGVGFHMGSIRSFRSFVFQANVVDIPLHGTKFTWSNNI